MLVLLALTASAFQSTLPARGATDALSVLIMRNAISIHAPCTGSDCNYLTPYICVYDFNPRSLHGERLAGVTTPSSPLPFQSTLPARGATIIKAHFHHDFRISIHAPCTGSDAQKSFAALQTHISIHAPCTGSDSPTPHQSILPLYFNPRSLHGERHEPRLLFPFFDISIHAPCTGSDDSTACKSL